MGMDSEVVLPVFLLHSSHPYFGTLGISHILQSLKFVFC